MKHSNQRLRLAFVLPALCAASFLLEPALAAQQNNAPAKRSKRSQGVTEEAKMEYDAQQMLNQGISALEQNQEERGIKAISEIARQYPNSKAAVKSQIVLADYFIEKRQYDQAIKRLQTVTEAKDPEVQAEALYKIGICYYNQNQYNQAFMSLRQVVNRFPGSIYANEAYYYIGLCHFSLNRWTQAVDALERVGTSVPPTDESKNELNLAEAGQRLFIKVDDLDLVVFKDINPDGKLTVQLTNLNGDKETIVMDSLGKEGSTYIGSITTEPGEPKPDDGKLQIKGGDEITVSYVDTHTATGAANVKILSKIKLVSTATVGFTTGSFQDYSGGIFADDKFFMRVRDLDMDITPNVDEVSVLVSVRYKEKKKEEEDLSAGLNLDEPEVEFKTRETRKYVLKETGPRTGEFTGIGKTELFDPETQIDIGNEGASEDPEAPLRVQREDVLVIEYQDDVYLLAVDNPTTRTFTANVVEGKLPDVGSHVRDVSDLQIRAKKNLLEGKMMLELARIFKDVGLVDFANQRAQTGIEKIDDLMKINAEAPLERAVLEDAFNVKWELLIVQDKIKEAIAVCSTLIKMFPESTLVDQALLKIAEIKIKEGSKTSVEEGLNIYRGILQLPKSELKPQAQFLLAEVMEQRAIDKAKEDKEKDPTAKASFGSVMVEYKKVADNYPDSPYAGHALGKIIKFYVDEEDFGRVIDMMDQIFRDYPDAEFLDVMLYNWALSAYQLNRFEVANEKCDQLISEYPRSREARKAQILKQNIQKKASSASGDEEE